MLLESTPSFKVPLFSNEELNTLVLKLHGFSQQDRDEIKMKERSLFKEKWPEDIENKQPFEYFSYNIKTTELGGGWKLKCCCILNNNILFICKIRLKS